MDLNLPVPEEDFIPVQNILSEVQFCEPKLLPIVSETVLEAEAKQQKRICFNPLVPDSGKRIHLKSIAFSS